MSIGQGNSLWHSTYPHLCAAPLRRRRASYCEDEMQLTRDAGMQDGMSIALASEDDVP